VLRSESTEEGKKYALFLLPLSSLFLFLLLFQRFLLFMVWIICFYAPGTVAIIVYFSWSSLFVGWTYTLAHLGFAIIGYFLVYLWLLFFICGSSYALGWVQSLFLNFMAHDLWFQYSRNLFGAKMKENKHFGLRKFTHDGE